MLDVGAFDTLIFYLFEGGNQDFLLGENYIFSKTSINYLWIKHFYELQIGECSFCEHPTIYWRGALSDMIFNGYPREYLIDKGIIPFANWSDWGLLCFDTASNIDNEYQIVLWDHDRADNWEFKSNNFEELLFQLNSADEYRE